MTAYNRNLTLFGEPLKCILILRFSRLAYFQSSTQTPSVEVQCYTILTIEDAIRNTKLTGLTGTVSRCSYFTVILTHLYLVCTE